MTLKADRTIEEEVLKPCRLLNGGRQPKQAVRCHPTNRLLSPISLTFPGRLARGDNRSGSWPRLIVLIAAAIQGGGPAFGVAEQASDRAQFLEDGAQQLLGCGRR
jgi:hypothetical protein